MTHSNRTPEDELKIRFIDLPARKWVGPYDDVVISVSALEEWILADRKAQATALLEKGPKDKDHRTSKLVNDDSGAEIQCNSDETKRLMDICFNRANAEWRSIIKEVGRLE